MRHALFGLTLVSLITPAAAEEVRTPANDQLRGFLEFRGALADGETSWLNEGFGKSRVDGGADAFELDPLARGMLIWTPHLSWTTDAFISLQLDSQMAPEVDVVEAYVRYRGRPADGWRFSGRAGLFYPPVSLEHDGPGWTTTETITPSAINSWIGEEVKVVGVEATARHQLWDNDFEVTLGLFGYNDTSGTLLAFRGWALGDVTPGFRDQQHLPERSIPYQETTKSTAELDDRAGYYARLQYRPVGNVTVDLTHYDNAGDRISDAHGLTDWETRFTNLGVRAVFDDTRLYAQAMTGETIWGMNDPVYGYWTDVDFNAAYVMLSHDFGAATLAGRVDYFQIGDNNLLGLDAADEEGWAATAAYQFPLTERVRLALEGMHIVSDRPARVDQGLSPDQQQTTLQSSVKVAF